MAADREAPDTVDTAGAVDRAVGIAADREAVGRAAADIAAVDRAADTAGEAAATVCYCCCNRYSCVFLRKRH